MMYKYLILITKREIIRRSKFSYMKKAGSEKSETERKWKLEKRGRGGRREPRAPRYFTLSSPLFVSARVRMRLLRRREEPSIHY